MLVASTAAIPFTHALQPETELGVHASSHDDAIFERFQRMATVAIAHNRASDKVLSHAKIITSLLSLEQIHQHPDHTVLVGAVIAAADSAQTTEEMEKSGNW